MCSFPDDDTDPIGPGECRISLKLFAENFQFYVQDDDNEVGDLAEAWTDEATQRMLAIAPRAVGLELTAGRLVIAGCTDYFPDAQRIERSSGTYRVRACARDLETVQPNDIDGLDAYEVTVWPSDPLGVRVVKQYIATS